MKCVFRFLTDTALTPNLKSKVASLKFLTNLITNYRVSDQFYYQEPASKALPKIISLTLDLKSIDVRNQAKSCIVALYNCNIVQMTKLLNELPKQFQDIASNVIQTHLRRSTSGTDSPHSPMSCGSPKPLQSPVQTSFQLGSVGGRTSRISSFEGDSMNSEEIYKSLRKTTAEIQNYSFENSGNNKLGRDTSSKDSGISQMSNAEIVVAPNGINGHSVDNESSNGSNGSKTQSADTSESDGQRELEIIEAAIKLRNDDPKSVKHDTLEALFYVIRHGNCQAPIENFKVLLRVLLEIMGNTSDSHTLNDAQSVVFAIFRRPEMKPCWISYVELLLLKIINNYKESKEIMRDTEVAIVHIAKVLPLELAIAVVNPIIATAEYPLNLCAVKLLTELTRSQGDAFTDTHLDTVIKNLAMLTDHDESTMRKAAVFCIVELHLAMGEERVTPRLSHLNASKMRLLNVYIQKSKSMKKT